MAWRKTLCCILNAWLYTSVLLNCIQLIKADLSCNFDDGLCPGWSQSYDDDIDWTNWSGPTPSYETGPSSDHSGNGSYMYIETSSSWSGETAKLVYSVPRPNDGKVFCLEFYYHMYGDTINTLNVYNGNTKIFTKTGNQGDVWLAAKITTTLQSKVTFEGISGSSYTGDIAIDDVSFLEGICHRCTINVNQTFGRLDITYNSNFDPYCNWIMGNAGIPQAFAVVSIHQMNFSGDASEYIKLFDGIGAEIIAVYGRDFASLNRSLQQISFAESDNITIQVSLISSLSYVKIDFGIVKQRLNSASLLPGWNVTFENKTTSNIRITWSHPTNLINGGVRFYVALARTSNSSSSSISTGEIVATNTTSSVIFNLHTHTEYNVGVIAVDGYGTPFKSVNVLIATDEGVCSFDGGLCVGWSQSYDDDFDWTNQYGSTPSYNTGPSSDHGGYGRYMYIETSSPRTLGETAKLVFSVLSSDVGKVFCLEFYYHMYGDTINTLNVYNGDTIIFTKSGEQGNIWLNAKITMTLQSKVTFEGISGTSYTGDIAIDDVSFLEGICQACTENMNQSFGRLDISYSKKFDPYCNWVIGNAGIPRAVVVVSIQHMNFSGDGSEYIKLFDGNGTEIFAVHGSDSASLNNSLREVSFAESNNMTIQVSLINSQSYVKIDFGIVKQRLNSASLLSGWQVTIVSKTDKSIGIVWSHPTNPFNGGIRFYVAFARKTNNSRLSTVEIVAERTTTSVISNLHVYSEYSVGVIAVDGYGMPFKSEVVLVVTDEGVPSSAPTGVRVPRFDYTSDLLVEWDPLPEQYANGKILGYTIYYIEYNSFWSPHMSVNTSGYDSTRFMLNSLKPAHEYLVAVGAFTSKGVGPKSDYIHATTGCSITLNETFGQIELTTTSYNDLRCKWEIQSAGIHEAIAFISVQELNINYCSEFVKIVNGNGTEVLYHLGCVSFAPEILADVPFGHSNNISIYVYTQSYGSSIKMEFAILKKGLRAAIPVSGWNVTISNVTFTSFTLQWTMLHTVNKHSAEFYIVEVKSVQGIILNVETVPGNTTTVVTAGLKPSTKYRVGVFGIDPIGQPYKTLESVATTKNVSCGSRPMITSRIVGGTVAPINSWPWQVMVMDNYDYQFCGGSLVDLYWVVTAAHCMVGQTTSSFKIRLGAHYRTSGSVGTEQDIKVAKIITHANYGTPLRFSHDIALINLASPAILGKGVGLVCLPDTKITLPFDNINKKCWVTGWGHLHWAGSSPNPLMQAAVPLVSKQRCANAYPGKIDDTMICTGFDAGGVSPCQGDSGGPLVCEFNGKWHLEGATSWAYKCAAPDKYNVFAKVRNLKSWLMTNMFTVVAPSVSPPHNQSLSALVWCNFEHGLCSGWRQSSSDDFDWSLTSGSTPSSSTGPATGHGGSGNYLYIEASSPRKPGENAKVVVAVPNNGNQSCLSFHYHMYGVSAGTLNVYSGNTKVFSVSGNQGEDWLIVERNFNLDGLVTFEGIIGSSYTSDIAIDQVEITKGRCPVSCNFDNGLCVGWSQSNQDDFDWTLNAGPTPSSSTGPSSDLSGKGKYMYIEATPQSYGDNAKLEFVLPERNTSACLTFYYYMYGSDMGTLNVLSGNTTIFTRSGDQGNYWRKVTRTVHLSDVLTFEGIVGLSYESDIAIDNVIISEGESCRVESSCNFDIGLCDGWHQSNSDVFDWSRGTGSTPSPNTGPDNDQTSGSGYYMYIETSSPRVVGDNAKLELSVSGNGEQACLTFYYHMYGEAMGTLIVFSGSAVVFSASGNHGNQWLKAEKTIHLNNIVIFEGIRGSDLTGELAIDDVSIISGSCQGQTTPTQLPTSTSGTSSPSPSTNKPVTSSGSRPTSTPKTPSATEIQESVLLKVRDLNINKWNEQVKNKFKQEVAEAATDFCTLHENRCLLAPTSSRRKRSSNKIVFTDEMVHILPGYPKQSPSDPLITLLAFYLQLPQGFSKNIVKKDTLIDIVKGSKSSIEVTIGGTIVRVQPLRATSKVDEKSDEERKPTSAIIGASVGGVLLLLIIGGILFGYMKIKSKRRAQKEANNDNDNNAFVNNAYAIESEEQAIEMKSSTGTDLSSDGHNPGIAPSGVGNHPCTGDEHHPSTDPSAEGHHPGTAPSGHGHHPADADPSSDGHRPPTTPSGNIPDVKPEEQQSNEVMIDPPTTTDQSAVLLKFPGEQAIEMKCSSDTVTGDEHHPGTAPSDHVPDMKSEEQHSDVVIEDPPTTTNQSAELLKFPEA